MARIVKFSHKTMISPPFRRLLYDFIFWEIVFFSQLNENFQTHINEVEFKVNLAGPYTYFLLTFFIHNGAIVFIGSNFNFCTQTTEGFLGGTKRTF